jgi:hypothetical protein
LHEAFLFAIVACLVAAGASLMRGGRYHYSAPAATDLAAARRAFDGAAKPASIPRFPIREGQHAG